MAFKLKGIAKYILIAVLVILVSFGIFEAFLQLRYPDVPFSGKNVSSLSAGPDFNYLVVTNSTGIREVSDYPLAHSGKYRIALIGDSFVFGNSANNDETIDSLLEMKYNNCSMPIEILNFGRAGIGPHGYLDSMQFARDNYSPDAYFVLLYLGNDFLNSYEDSFSGAKNILKSCRSCMLFYDAFINISKQSDPENKDIPNNVYHKAKDDPQFFARGLLIAEPQYISDASSAFENDLQEMKKFADAENKKIYFIAIPSPFQVSDKYFTEFGKMGFAFDEKMLSDLKPQSEFAAICSKNNFLCYDLSNDIINSPEKESLYWPRDEHFKPAGYALAADLLHDAVYPQMNLGCN